ncbi:type II toxin-antitoxin system RelE/ParE family toxin [Streptomyces sp. BE133]|nr:type II toxin-antitoxin system RelE/ParE family toxin [Streptomyces sp. BE133]MEE1808600.1 type II toxin-antitoxin system RelE/ParE family toxin [Streptomyces sp. BE133]
MAEVRRHLADAIDPARRDETPTIITRRGKSEAVQWRLRIGDYRAVYTVEDGQLTLRVLAVAHRGEVYRSL